MGSIFFFTLSQMAIVIETRFSDIVLIDGSVACAKNCCPIAPKIWLIDAVDGSVTFITWKWRFARFGMSFLPAPGWSIAPSTSRSTMPLNSPGLSRL